VFCTIALESRSMAGAIGLLFDAAYASEDGTGTFEAYDFKVSQDIPFVVSEVRSGHF
jgi:hypothetical protein